MHTYEIENVYLSVEWTTHGDIYIPEFKINDYEISTDFTLEKPTETDCDEHETEYGYRPQPGIYHHFDGECYYPDSPHTDSTDAINSTIAGIVNDKLAELNQR